MCIRKAPGYRNPDKRTNTPSGNFPNLSIPNRYGINCCIFIVTVGTTEQPIKDIIRMFNSCTGVEGRGLPRILDF